MTHATLLDRIKQTGEPVILPHQLGNGTVTAWHRKPGEHIDKWEELATVITTDGVVNAISSPVTGTVKALMVRDQTLVEAGTVLAYIAPEPVTVSLASQPGTEDRRRNAESQSEVAASQAAPHHLTAPRSLERRSTLGGVSPLVVEELLAPSAASRKRPRPKRPKVVKMTAHPTDEQVGRFNTLLAQLAQQGHDYSFAELQRTAFEWLLSLNECDLVEYAEQNRDREQAGRFGYGNRPGC